MIKDFKKDLDEIRAMEREKQPVIKVTNHALSFHLMPPVGWLNDPNGLCQCNGIYHIFFQYSPKNPNGGEKYWGHFMTKDFIEYSYTGPFMSPDNDLDRDGVYSGSAFVEDGIMNIYYTGNVKEKGDYDYTYSGRLSNTILVETKDGTWTDEKRAVLTNKDYPEGLSCHIRDPKVFRDKNEYKMVLGARTMDDVGCVLLYKSKDKVNWEFESYIKSEKTFGYMWECPDIIELEGKKFLSISPQGVESKAHHFQNIYQSGYFQLKEGSYEINESKTFAEWDMGFDFYAPQSFVDESGRQILIGWMGIPDADYSNEAGVKDGWQHALTMARELLINENGNICQRPVREYEALRTGKAEVKNGEMQLEGVAQISCYSVEDKSFCVRINEALVFEYDSDNKLISLSFDSEKEELDGVAKGYGRRVRYAEVDKVNNFNIYLDTSAVEIFANDGETVFSSRYYCNTRERKIHFSKDLDVEAYELKSFTINI